MPSNYNNRTHQGPPVLLNVAEKPSVARALAAVFNRMPESREVVEHMPRDEAQIFTHDNVLFPDVFSQGNNNNNNNSTNQRVPHRMITTSVRGHLAGIGFPKEYTWGRCDPLQLFEVPLEVTYSDGNERLRRMLANLSKKVDVLILWLDCDREGEAIGDEVLQACVDSNRRLTPYVYRAKFSTVMDGEIKRALNTLGRINDNFVQAVKARTELDLRVGAAFTRFQTNRLQKKFTLPGNGEGGNNVVSYGPCQFPTLGFVVERWARIETFVPYDFWFLELSLSLQVQPSSGPDSDGNNSSNNNNNNRNNRNIARPIVFTWKRQRLYDRFATLALYESCLDATPANTATVIRLEGRPKNKWRPLPLATIELQKRASRYLRIGSETLMKAAEALYQNGLISYPRTETERFRQEFQHHPLIRDFSSLSDAAGPYASYANRLLNENGYQTPRAGQNDDQAHPPITPCKVVDPNTIPDLTQRNVYVLVVKHYLACCSRDAVGRETSLTLKIASEEFTAKGLMVEQKNWLEIYQPWERWSQGQGELPHLMVGSRVTPESLLMKEGQTSPPLPISEPELITIMDKSGIGTDATIAQHIATIQNRDYATKDSNLRFSPTKLGIALVEGYNNMGYQLNKPDLRRETERECNLVANGQKSKEDIVRPLLDKMKDCYIVATRDAHKLDQAMARHYSRVGTGNDTEVLQANFSECGKCQRSMSLKQDRQTGNNSGGGRGRGGRGRGRGNNNHRPRKLLFCNTCQEGWVMPQNGDLRPKREEGVDRSPVKCAICNFQVIAIARGGGYEGNGYNICPKCFNDPPTDHGGSSGGNHRCFSCSHPTCAIAGGTQGGDIEVFACPFCREKRIEGGKVMLRKNTRGYVLSCTNYSARQRCSFTIWLPRASRSIEVPAGDENVCSRCSTQSAVRKISFFWKPGGVLPHLGRESTVCILCDERFRQDVQIQLPQMDRVGTNNRGSTRARGGTNTSHNGNNNDSRTKDRRSNGRPLANNTNFTCYVCNQPGHFADRCPNRNQ